MHRCRFPFCPAPHRALALWVGAALLCLSSAASAGPWNKPRGHGYAKLGSATFLSDHAYDNRGTELSSDPFRMTAETLYGYLEYGLIDDVMLVVYAPYVLSTNAHASGVSFHTLGFGDASVGIQVPLWDPHPVAIATRLDLKVPLYQGAPTVRGRQTRAIPGYPRTATYFPALGDGQVDLTAWLSAGASLPVANGFAALEAGYRLRSGPITDALVLQGNAGVWLLPTCLLLWNFGSVVSFPSPDEATVFVGKGYVSTGPALMWFVYEQLALEVGGDFVGFGVNSAGGVQAQVGVSYAF